MGGRKERGVFMHTEILEAVMMICFGLSWPASILRSWRSRTTRGKSLFFLVMISVGYGAGIVWKLIDWRRTGKVPYQGLFYLLNLTMVLIDVGLYFRNLRLDRERSTP